MLVKGATANWMVPCCLEVSKLRFSAWEKALISGLICPNLPYSRPCFGCFRTELDATKTVRYLHRLLHSSNQAALGLSVGYETWSPIGCFVISVIGWSMYNPGNTSHQMHNGLTWPMGISIGFQTPLTVSLHSPNSLPLGLCKRTVKESNTYINCNIM